MKTKIIALVMTIVVLVGTGIFSRSDLVYAATESQQKGFTIDENVYNVNWEETGKINVYGTGWTVPGAYLGYANIQTGFATTKKPVDKYYYQRVLIKADMKPQILSGSLRGMSQHLTIKIKNEENMKNLEIEPAAAIGSTSYNISTTHMFGGNLSVGYSKDGFSVNGGRDYSTSIASSASFVEDSLNICTNSDSGGYGRWDYDYVSSGYSSKQNLYLFASSTQRGLYSWNMPKNVNGFYVSTRLDVEVTFGAGTYGGTHRLSDRGSYNLGSTFKSKKIIWN